MAEDSEDVGYKKPPRRTRFKPGMSGNPTGKRKGVRSIAAELQDILDETITFASDGAVKTMSKQRALASSLVTAAISGDFRATAIVMSHLAKESREHADGEIEPDDFPAARNHKQRKAKSSSGI